MILSGFGKLIKAIFDGFVNLLVILLIKAGMWLPALFSIVFMILCLASGVGFSGVTTGLFFAGLIITAIIGAVTAFRRYIKL